MSFNPVAVFIACVMFLFLAGTLKSAAQPVPLPTGYTFACCNVDGTGGNNINNGAFLQGAVSDPNGILNTVIYVWNCGGNFNAYQYFSGADAANYFLGSPIDGWYDAAGNLVNVTWNPGEGMIFFNPAPPTTLTMSGTPAVPVLPPVNYCGCDHWSLLCPQTTNAFNTYQDVTGFAPQEGAQVAFGIPTNGTFYATDTYANGAWTPNLPILTNNQAAYFWVPCAANGSPSNCCANCMQPYPLSYTNTIFPGNNFFANHLCQGTNNSVNEVLVEIKFPDSASQVLDLLRWNPVTQQYEPADTFYGPTDTGGMPGWYDQSGNPSTAIIAPGEGFVIHNASGASYQIVIRGCDPTCPPPCSPPTNGFVLVGRRGIGTAVYSNLFSCPPVCGTQIRRWNGSGFTDYNFANGFWTPPEPVLAVGESVFVTVHPCCPLVVNCPTNKNIPCTSNVVFDLPVVTNSCCGTNYSISVFGPDVIGSLDPCTTFTTRTWLITDCNGNTNLCSQTISASPASSYTLTLQPGFNLIANQLDNGNNSANILFPNSGSRDGDALMMYSLGSNCLGGFTGYMFDSGSPSGFDDQSGSISVPAPTLSPGMGAFYVNNSGVPETVTFTGTPNCTNPPPALTCPCGTYYLWSRSLDCYGTFENVTGLIPQEGAQVLRWNGSGYTASTYSGGSWTPTTPMLNVGEAAFFMIPCPTNPCITLDCTPNKTVQCGSSWSFDAPSNVVDHCCTNISVAVSTETNGTACSPAITRTWLYTDVCGHSNLCSQTVTLVGCCENTTCCGTNAGARMIKWLPCPLAGPPVLLPNPSGANSGGTWIVTNLPCYGKVLVTQTFPNNTSPQGAYWSFWYLSTLLSSAPGPQGAYSFVQPGYGPYSWAAFNSLFAFYSANPVNYQVKFYFLDGPPNPCTLYLGVAGLGSGSTATVSQPVVFRTEYDQLANGSAGGPSANTTLDGIFGPAVSGSVGTVVGSAFSSNHVGSLVDTGLGVFQPTNDVTTVALPLGSGLDMNGNSYPLAGTYPCLSLTINQAYDGLGVTVGYVCCTNSTTDCIQVVCPSDKTVLCGMNWNFDAPSNVVDLCCSNWSLSYVDSTVHVECPQIVTRTWTVSDVCGNSKSCNQTVTVINTNPPVLNCASNKTVECGSAWSFDPPTGVSACCGSNVTITLLGTGTNGVCPKIITRTWQATDCCSNTATCSQTVTVVNTNPPTMIGVTNRTVACGSAWSFTTPNVTDPCGGTNIIVTALTPVTNGACPKFITQVWVATNLCNGLTATATQVVTAVSCVPPPAGLVGWWSGDNTPNDLSSYGNTATLQNGVLYAPGMVASAFSFPATSATASVSVATPVAGSLDFGNNVPFSIDAWINTTSTGVAVIVDKRSGDGSQGNTFGYSFFVASGRLGFQLGSGLYGNFVSAGPAINDGRWHFVVATVNRATKQVLLYVDNTLVLTASTTTAEGNVSNTGAFLIGQRGLSGAVAFSGLIDEVEVFNQVLGLADIASIYNAGPAGKCKSPKLVCSNSYSIPCTQQLFIFNPPTINDPCGCPGNQTVNQFGSDVTGGTTCARTYTRTWVYVDCCANSNFCSQTVTITNVPPVITSAPIGANLGCNPVLPTDSSIMAQVKTTIGCNLTTNVTHIDSGTPCAMSRTFNVNVTDACGNYSQTSMTYTWKNDTAGPVLQCPNKTYVVPLDKNCNLVIPKITGITAKDNCTPASQLHPIQSPLAGQVMPGPSQLVTVTYTDACGNSSHCTVTVQGVSKTGPVLHVPASLTVSNCLVPCVSNLVSVTGGCCPPGSIKITQSPACDTEIGPGVNSITVTATDCNGNVSKKTIKLVVLAPGSFLSSLNNTGTDENHAVISFGLLDYHYGLTPPNGVTTCYSYSGNAVGVKGPWILPPVPPTGSDWISPCKNSFDSNAMATTNGYYTYTYSFLLPPGSDPNTASISGRWAASQSGYASINGYSDVAPYGMNIPSGANGAGQWRTFTISAGFHAGVNTITWHIYSKGSPNGLRVEYTSATVCSTCAPPTIASITSEYSIPNNGIGALSVAASGTQPMSYQWYRNGTKLVNGSPYFNVNTANLLINPVHYANAGLYTVVISNGCGSVTGKVNITVSLGFAWNWGWWNIGQLDYPLAAAFGPDLNLVGTSDYGTNYTLTAGTTDDFGLPAVGGQIANIMHVAPLPADTSIQIPQIAPAGSNSLNSYSFIMDLYEPDTAVGTPSILFKNSCCLGSSGQDGVEITLDAQNFLHLSGYAAGTPFDIVSASPMPSNTWTRVAMVIDDPQDGVGINLSLYEDGQQLGSLTVATPVGLSVNWSNSAPTILSRQADDVSVNGEFYIASIQFHAVALTAEQLAGMGSPDTGAMPADDTEVGPAPVLNAAVNNGVVNLSWAGNSYVLQETADLTSGDWVDSALPLFENLDGSQTTAIADPSVEGPIKFYRLIFRP